MEPRKLSCPSCGATIEIPAELTRAHCLYCGSLILIPAPPRDDKAARQDDLKILLGLLKTAKEAWNLSDMVAYSDRVLEIDDNSALAWSCKGLATSCLSTWTEDRFHEGRAYIDKALSIDPENHEVVSASEEWTSRYLHYLDELSRLQWDAASDVWHAQPGRDGLLFRGTAQRTVAPYAQAALSTVDKGLSVVDALPPGPHRDQAEATFLNMRVAFLQSAITQPEFGNPEPARARLQELSEKRRVRDDLEILSELRHQLEQIDTEISNLKQGGGLFANRKLRQRLKARQDWLERIERAEKLQQEEAG